jgi:hypothetical protein
MRTKLAIWLVMTAIVLESSVTSLAAQEQTGDNNKAPVAAKAVRPYRLDFVIKEMEGGKKINSRHYSTDINAGEADTIKIGTRVPIVTGGKDAFPEQWQYMDVGTTIHCRLFDRGDDLVIDVHTEVSDFAIPGQIGSPMAAGGGASAGASASPAVAAALHPVVRQMVLDGVTLLVTDKPMTIASVDDPNSNREFQLEVTATKLK